LTSLNNYLKDFKLERLIFNNGVFKQNFQKAIVISITFEVLKQLTLLTYLNKKKWYLALEQMCSLNSVHSPVRSVRGN